jgi:hypothetical protein
MIFLSILKVVGLTLKISLKKLTKPKSNILVTKAKFLSKQGLNFDFLQIITDRFENFPHPKRGFSTGMNCQKNLFFLNF